MEYMSFRRLPALCFLLFWVLVDDAIAESERAMIEEIVVTAQKREQGVQEVPLSISAFSGDQLEQGGFDDMTQLSYFVPSFSLNTGNNSRNTTASIRGIGTSGTNPGIEPSVGIFVDGVYLPSGGQILGNLVDIERVEILRGPQGTLYGRNTPVGAVNISTRRPTQAFEAMINAQAGDYDFRSLRGFLSGGVSDVAAGRLSFWTDDRDGYLDNLSTGSDVNDESERGARLRFVYDASDNLVLDFVVHTSVIERRCCVAEQLDVDGSNGIATPGFLAAQAALGFPFRNFDDEDYVVDADDEGDDETTNWGGSMRADWSLPSGATLTSITAYEDWDNDLATVASDSLPQNVFTTHQQQINETLSQELRLASDVDGDVDYIVGLYLYSQDTRFTQDNVIGPGANRNLPPPICRGVAPCGLQVGDAGGTLFDQETRSAALFGSITWRIAAALDLTTGLRLARDSKDVFIDHFNAAGNGPAFTRLQAPSRPGDLSRDDTSVTWSVGTRFYVNDEVMLFARADTGVKSGGFNSRRLAPGAIVEFQEENSTSFDVGIKATWFERRLVTNATLFWTELEDFQASVQNPDPNIPGFIVGNAGDHEVQGVELDLIARPIVPLTVRAAVAVLDAGFVNFVGVEDAEPSQTPDLKYSISADWRQPLRGTFDWFARADYAWIDDQILGGRVQENYGLLNARVGMGSNDGRWELSAWVKNATEETYYVAMAAQPVQGFISGGGFAGARGSVAWYGAPRTAGVEFVYRLQ